MLRELSIDGVLVSPLLPYCVATIPVFWLVDKLLQRFGGYRCFWHPALVRLALFVILLTLLFFYGRFE
jgi:protein AaeX